MAMRKVFYGSEDIMLKHILRLYDKQSLWNYACALQIRRMFCLKCTMQEKGIISRMKNRSACVKTSRLI